MNKLNKKDVSFRMNEYRLQYWLYAILNKEFGHEVKFHRDALHQYYSVNRHGFNVTTNTQHIDVVKKSLLSKLKQAGFTEEKDKRVASVCLVKNTMRTSGKEQIVIMINECNRSMELPNHDKPSLMIQGYVYSRGLK